MPWFETEPTTADTNWWGVYPSSLPHPVSRWPNKLTPRTDARFRFQHQLNDTLDALAIRYYHTFYTGIKQGGPGPTFKRNWGYFDLSLVDVGHLQSVSEQDADDFVVQFDVREFDALPVNGGPGIQSVWELRRAANRWYRITREHEKADPGSAWRVDMDVTRSEQPPIVEESPQWNYQTSFGDQFWEAVSDCYLFPAAPPAPALFAQGNGVDAYVQMRNFSPVIQSIWQVTFKLRIRSKDSLWILGSSLDANDVLGLPNDVLRYDINSAPISPPLAVGPVLDIEIERRWRDSGDFSVNLWVDNVKHATIAGGGEPIRFDRFLGNFPAGSPEWADVDIWDMVVKDQGVSPNDEAVNYPFTTNACDTSPFNNHADTFNMPLPSCPV